MLHKYAEYTFFCVVILCICKKNTTFVANIGGIIVRALLWFVWII